MADPGWDPRERDQVRPPRAETKWGKGSDFSKRKKNRPNLQRNSAGADSVVGMTQTTTKPQKIARFRPLTTRLIPLGLALCGSACDAEVSEPDCEARTWCGSVEVQLCSGPTGVEWRFEDGMIAYGAEFGARHCDNVCEDGSGMECGAFCEMELDALECPALGELRVCSSIFHAETWYEAAEGSKFQDLDKAHAYCDWCVTSDYPCSPGQEYMVCDDGSGPVYRTHLGETLDNRMIARLQCTDSSCEPISCDRAPDRNYHRCELDDITFYLDDDENVIDDISLFCNL